jgi:5-methylcytosine-specific restriction endonuclease McrA
LGYGFGRGYHPSDFVVYPGELPWWEIKDSHDRSTMYYRQLHRKLVERKECERILYIKKRLFQFGHIAKVAHVKVVEPKTKVIYHKQRQCLCPVCLTLRATSTHHIIPREMGGSDDDRNIISLCPRCHDLVEIIYHETGECYSPSMAIRIRLTLLGAGTSRMQLCVAQNH